MLGVLKTASKSKRKTKTDPNATTTTPPAPPDVPTSAKTVHFPQDSIDSIDPVQQALDEEDKLLGVVHPPPMSEDPPTDEPIVTTNEKEVEKPKKRSKTKLFHKPGMPITYISSREKILTWVNTFMETNMTKIDDLGTGIAYCLFMNRLCSGCIDLNRIRFRHKDEQSYIHNFRLIQDALKNLFVNKVIPVHKLVKCRFHDNLEFALWFKKFFDENYEGQLPYGHLEENGEISGLEGSVEEILMRRMWSNREIPVKTFMNYRPQRLKEAAKLSHLNCQLAEVKLSTAAMELERDFYFKKLQQVEAYCRQEEIMESGEIQIILGILYVTQEGFTDPFAIMEGVEVEDEWDDLDEE